MAQDLARAGGVIPAEVLALIPGCEDGRPPLAMHPLPGGRGCNQVLRVDTAQGRFVWRRRFLPIDRPGSRAMDELRAQQLAATAGLAPAILAAHDAGHWLLMEFVDAPIWTVEQLHSDAGVTRLGGQLARLRALAVPAELPVVDTTAMADDYLRRLAGHAAAEAAELAPLRDRIATLSEMLSQSGMAPVLNHGDLTVSNMLGPAPMLVDWEYAQVAEAGWDLACLLTYYPRMSGLLPRLLAGSDDSRTLEAMLQIQRERFSLLNRLWERLAAHEAG